MLKSYLLIRLFHSDKLPIIDGQFDAFAEKGRALTPVLSQGEMERREDGKRMLTQRRKDAKVITLALIHEVKDGID
jgi:hypothetical protein